MKRRKKYHEERSLFGGSFGFFGGIGALLTNKRVKKSQTIGQFNLMRFNLRKRG